MFFFKSMVLDPLLKPTIETMKLLKPTIKKTIITATGDTCRLLGATKVDDDVDDDAPSWDARADQVRRGDIHS